MKKIILYCLFTLLLAGCVNKLNNFRNPKPQTVESETFEKIDVDNSGEISKTEFKQISNKNREAMDNFSRTFTKYSNLNYFDRELKDAAASRWWDNQDLENEF